LIHEAANLPGFDVVAIHDCVVVPLPYVSKMKELYPRVLKKNLGRVTGEQFFDFWPNLSFRENPCLWQDAESPYEALSMCFEWERYVRHQKAHPGRTYTSDFLVLIDATASGMQILAHVNHLCDPFALASLNLLPADSTTPVGDLYGYLVELWLAELVNRGKPAWAVRLLELFRSRAAEKDDPLLKKSSEEYEILKLLRKIFKTPLMTVSYSVTLNSFTLGALEKAHELVFKFPDRFEEHPGVENLWDRTVLSEMYLFITSNSGLFGVNRLLNSAVTSPFTWTNDLARVTQDYRKFTTDKYVIPGRRGLPVV
jgi:hypothetical protein